MRFYCSQSKVKDQSGIRKGLGSKQRGAVMIVALMLLLVMTVLAISGIGNSTLEQQMSGNYFRSSSAFQSAEYGLRVAEEWVVITVPTGAWQTWFQTAGGPDGLYTTQDLTPTNSTEVCRGDIDCSFNPNDESAWCAGASCALPKGFITLGDDILGNGNILPQLDILPDALNAQEQALQPRLIIEYIGPVGADAPIQIGVPPMPAPRQGFRITVIGWGQDRTSHHVLQSHVSIPL